MDRKISGFFSQIKIITWKNFLLYKQNISGLICEIVFSCLFIIIFFLLSYTDIVQYRRSTEFRPQEPIINPYEIDEFIRNNKTNVFYYPNSIFINRILADVFSDWKELKFFGYEKPNLESVNDETLSTMLTFVSFNFNSSVNIPDKIEYSIHTLEENRINSYRTHETLRPKSDFLYENSAEYFCQRVNYQYDQKYKIFNAIKYKIDIALMKEIIGKQLDYNMSIGSFSCPQYFDSNLKSLIGFISPMMISLAFMVTFLITVSAIINEKESKMKEYLRLIGVKPTVIWLCWMMRSFCIYLLISIIVTIASTVKFNDFYYDYSDKVQFKKAFFLHSDPFIVFLTVIVYSFQCTCLSLLVGQIFSRPFAAKTVSIIFWFVTLINFYNSVPSVWKYIISVLPNTALYFALQIFYQYERSSRSLDFKTLFKNLYGDELNLGALLISMFLWSWIYMGLSWYIERINPGEYGVKLPWYFPFMKSYWFESKAKIFENKISNANLDQEAFEKEPNLNASVQIKNLTKIFKTGFEEKKAVDNLSLNFYENQITGFLGHNGAGKTTVTFILCGLYTPESGTATILGHDIRTHMNKIRASIGFCPQANILYDELTVEQHLDLIASIKGFSKKEINHEIKRISSYVGLQNDLSKKSKELSGGMKRRLSVAMALIGDSKLIILDEPSSGLDPFNRRSLWEIIRNYKSGRTIIISTHYMEEADALSDRIAVMNHGQVKCCGSPMFLKHKFGSGYRLILTKNENFNLQNFENVAIEILGRELEVQSNIAREISLSIPNELNFKLPVFLNFIERNKKKIGVLNYGISSATIEEVFLKIGNIDINDGDQSSTIIKNQDLKNAFDNKNERNTGTLLIIQQLKSLIYKRCLIFLRRFKIFIFTLLFPGLIQAILSAVIPSTSSFLSEFLDLTDKRNIPPYSFDINKYNPQTLVYRITGDNRIQAEEYFLKYYSKLNLIKIKDYKQTVNDYVFDKRRQQTLNLVSNYYFGIDLESNLNSNKITGLYSTVHYQTSTTILNEINSFILSLLTLNDKKSIRTINAPFSIGKNYSSKPNYDFNDLQFLNCFEIIPFSFLDFINGIIIAFMISLTTIHLTKEKRNGSKSLQLLSGTNYITYWISNYIFDFLIYLFQIVTLIIVIKIVGSLLKDPAHDTYIITRKDLNLVYLFIFMVLSSFTWSSLAYLWSNFLKSDIVSFVVLFIILSFAALLDMICVVVIFFDSSSPPSGALSIIANILRIILIILCPNVAIKRAMFNIKLQNIPICIDTLNNFFKSKLDKNSSGFDFNEPGIGKLILLNMILFILSNALIFLIELKLFGRLFDLLSKKKTFDRNYSKLEEDVKTESERIDNLRINSMYNQEPLVVANLVKEFKKNRAKFKAVDNLSFGVESGECFGLLGVNGAGKTTTIQILIGDLRSTRGEAYLGGYNVKTNRSKAISSIGYCPQYEYLPDFLTVRQTLSLFANLRGIKPSKINGIIEDFMNVFKLNEFKNKLVQNLSGGNKRKVSSAIAFIGKPKIVILDEPTSGMDPAARRYLWNVIKNARDLGMTILLTTHSMEESEALCSKLGIMVNGQFQCFGNIQKLKNKFGKGYSLTLKCKTFTNELETQAKMRQVENFVQVQIPNTVLQDKQEQTLFYQIMIDDENFSIAKIFELIEKNKQLLDLETYSVSQTTLEQVFLSFSKQQIVQDKNVSEIRAQISSSIIYQSNKDNGEIIFEVSKF